MRRLVQIHVNEGIGLRQKRDKELRWNLRVDCGV